MPLLYNLDSLFWRICEKIYTIPTPPKRVRPKDKPMQVICVGLPRSATESLQQALLILGYDHTYHGWDVVFEQPCYAVQWVNLAKKKWNGTSDGDCHISAAEFDEIIGHSVAVTDMAASCFAAEMIEAYPHAKVILNTRTDLEKWHQSVCQTILGIQVNWTFWLLAFFNSELFWNMYCADVWMWPGLFRFPHGSLEVGIRKNGKWIYRGMNKIDFGYKILT